VRDVTTSERPAAITSGRRLRRRLGGERGTALIETAMTLPLLLLVSVGIFEFGRAFQTWQVLTNAAREGARLAVMPGSTDATVKARVQTYLTSGQLTNTPAIVVNARTLGPGRCLRCRAVASRERRELERLRHASGRRCAIIQTPLSAPPPRGAKALEAWERTWTKP